MLPLTHVRGLHTAAHQLSGLTSCWSRTKSLTRWYSNETSERLDTHVTPVEVKTHNCSSHDFEGSPYQDYVVNPEFHNRNPRNNERLGFSKKRIGWKYQSPRLDYYHKLIFEKNNTNTSGRVEHWRGKTVMSASTSEWAIQQHLHSCLDVSAAENVGRVLAQRCLQCGFTHMFYDTQPQDTKSESLQAFLTSLRDGHISLTEPEWTTGKYEPGIDYDKPNRYDEDKQWKDDIQVS